MGDFKLLQHLSGSLKNPQSMSLEQLRSTTREFITLRNKVIEYIWSLKGQLSRASESIVRLDVSKQISEVQQSLDKCASEQQIKDLLKEIKDKEIIEIGCSSIGGSTPYSL